MPIFTIQEVVIDKVVKGRNSYQVATVKYTTNRDESKEKKIMSFANPAVFATAQKAVQGQQYDVAYVPNDEYYNWASMTLVGASEAATSTSKQVPGQKTTVSTYETADERKIKQLYIIRQSSIANAIDYLSKTNEPFNTIAVLEVAQEFVDFVYGTNETLAEMDSDIPY